MATNAVNPKTSPLKMISGKLFRSPKKAHQKSISQSNMQKKDLHSNGIPLDTLPTLCISPSVEDTTQVVVAIDFGTTYSGYAYAFNSSPDDIYLMRRPEGGQFGMVTHKIPTILLLNDKGGFHSFGYEARETYFDLSKDEAQKWFYFEKFKMELHSRKELNRYMELECSNGQRVLASVVFSHALKYFKDSCLKEINEGAIEREPIDAKDIQWVITVPAIWRQSAKQFMRDSAIKAGLIDSENPKQLIIALEPEAASIYCCKLRLKECIPDPQGSPRPASATPSPSTGAPKRLKRSPISDSSINHSRKSGVLAADFTHGMRYMVADCGGGTVDLTVHELEEHNKIKELYKATGGGWGSMGVDCQFEILLVDIFGQEFLVDFVKSKPASWLELMSTFEAKKRVFSPHKQLPTNISLPFSFIEYYREKTGETVESAVVDFDDEGIQWSSQGMLRLQPEVMMSFFEPVTATIVQHIQDLLNIPELSDIKYLFLVGGFAESPVLQETIQNAFRAQLKVIIPQDVSLTILKGAVMFGQDPTLVHVRRSILTYGVGCLNKFIPGVHPPEKRVLKNGQEWCDEVFDTFVFADQAISLGHTITRSYTTAYANKQSTKISLFASENPTVHFVTDPGCSKVADLRLDVSGGGGIGEPAYRELKVSMMFGSTEITVEAVDCASGQITKAAIDFLNR